MGEKNLHSLKASLQEKYSSWVIATSIKNHPYGR
ncbi:hypothetical protein NIES267_41970 [Calothrix parasitica NIES-267]|uniref:Uncharacterized protein n=1 Tax=Calothrix parasitica NIES-267 TaxID=1973488 RepID=A0A1Z4LU68_9CYAN|nr:hypothetical protein NIES267_41970 [Calothrix parasitica NIES-267]